MDMVELGDRVKDKISGLKGVVVGITNYLYGCRRVSVQPEESKDGKPAEWFVLDEPQLDIVKKNIISPRIIFCEERRSYGPAPDVPRKHEAKK